MSRQNQCYECGSTDKCQIYSGNWICEKCAIWYDYPDESEDQEGGDPSWFYRQSTSKES